MGSFSTLRRHTISVLILAGALLPLPSHAGTDNNVGIFRQALAAARSQDWKQLDTLEAELPKDFPLRGYLDFHRLTAKLPDASPDEVLDYTQRYQDLPLARDMRQRALAAWGRAGRWAAIRSLGGAVPRTVALRCYYLRAWMDKRPHDATEGGRILWLSGHSRPPACDPLFDALRKSGTIDDDAVWQRLQMALHAGNPGLARYLGKMLDSKHQQAAEDALKAWQDPEKWLARLSESPDDSKKPAATAALFHLAGNDPATALKWLKRTADTPDIIDESDRAELHRLIAHRALIHDIKDLRPWLDRWLTDHGDADMIEQRARLAVQEQDWKGLTDWISRLPVAEQKNAHWQYWLGRAWHKQREDKLAYHAFRHAASQRSFYGFLAAKRLGQDFALNRQAPPQADPDRQGKLASRDDMQRVALLQQAGADGLAEDEWRQILYHSDADQRLAMAAYASSHDWYHLAIKAALGGDSHDVLAWRFPAAYRKAFHSAATRHDLDPWLLMAVARRESSFNPAAHSPVGAVGLMQVMPKTAERVADVADDAAVTGVGPDDLRNPDTSIELGSAFLAALLNRFQDNRIEALAAYNAGPHRVMQWLPDKPVPFDVWIESIPYRETRDYVQAVLAYRLILERLHGDDQQQVALLHDNERAPIKPPADSDGGDDLQLTQR